MFVSDRYSVIGVGCGILKQVALVTNVLMTKLMPKTNHQAPGISPPAQSTAIASRQKVN